MEVKLEEKLFSPMYNTVCNMCLSSDRRVSSVDSVSYAYGLMTDWASQEGARVCWECRALLVRVLRFKVQALRAKEFLDAAGDNFADTDILSGKCMSQLAIKIEMPVYAGDKFFRKDRAFKVKPTSKKHKRQKVKINTEDKTNSKSITEFEIHPEESAGEVWAEDLPETEVEIKPKFEIEISQVEVKYEECKQTRKTRVKTEVKRTRKSEVKRSGKLKVKRSGKPEVKRRVRRVHKRARSDDIIEMFTVTLEELNVYKENALNSIEKSSAFMCKMCIEGFKYEVNYQKHKEQFHSEEAGRLVCDVCTSRFKSAALLGQHRSKHLQMYRCRYPGCSYTQHMRRNVRTHYSCHVQAEQLTHDRIGGDVFECDLCGKVFPLRRQLANHIRRHNKKHLCELCSYRCSNSTQLRTHMLAHLDPSHRKFECEQCHKRFTDRQKLTYHIRSHTGERPFQCETCGAKFTNKEEMTRHIKLRHIKTDVDKKKFSQPRTKSSFINNRPNFPPRITAIKDPFSNKYECHICKKHISSRANLRKHYFTHSERNLKCEECDKSFKDPFRLQLHFRNIHKGDKPHQCSVCGARYATKSALNVHMISHSDEKPFQCDECNASFKYKANLSAHKLIHTGEKLHQCNICGSSFTLKGNLSGHMKIHTNERPFECNVCGKKFAWNRNLKNHFKTHVK